VIDVFFHLVLGENIVILAFSDEFDSVLGGIGIIDD
jgi:hypothetical protein